LLRVEINVYRWWFGVWVLLRNLGFWLWIFCLGNVWLSFGLVLLEDDYCYKIMGLRILLRILMDIYIYIYILMLRIYVIWEVLLLMVDWWVCVRLVVWRVKVTEWIVVRLWLTVWDFLEYFNGLIWCGAY